MRVRPRPPSHPLPAEPELDTLALLAKLGAPQGEGNAGSAQLGEAPAPSQRAAILREAGLLV